MYDPGKDTWDMGKYFVAGYDKLFCTSTMTTKEWGFKLKLFVC